MAMATERARIRLGPQRESRQRIKMNQWAQTHCCPTYSLSFRDACRERGCSVCFVVTGIHVRSVIAVCINIFFHDVTGVSISSYGTALSLTPLIIPLIMRHAGRCAGLAVRVRYRDRLCEIVFRRRMHRYRQAIARGFRRQQRHSQVVPGHNGDGTE